MRHERAAEAGAARTIRSEPHPEPRNPCASFEIGIPTRDGVELAADGYLPNGQNALFPAIVECTPYDKSGSLITDDVSLYSRNGHAVLIVDPSGRGKSDGEWLPPVYDAPDCHDVVEWSAVRPWCTGKVGMNGLSSMG